jgi:hypothetical protein
VDLTYPATIPRAEVKLEQNAVLAFTMLRIFKHGFDTTKGFVLLIPATLCGEKSQRVFVSHWTWLQTLVARASPYFYTAMKIGVLRQAFSGVEGVLHPEDNNSLVRLTGSTLFGVDKLAINEAHLILDADWVYEVYQKIGHLSYEGLFDILEDPTLTLQHAKRDPTNCGPFSVSYLYWSDRTNSEKNTLRVDHRTDGVQKVGFPWDAQSLRILNTYQTPLNKSYTGHSQAFMCASEHPVKSRAVIRAGQAIMDTELNVNVGKNDSTRQYKTEALKILRKAGVFIAQRNGGFPAHETVRRTVLRQMVRLLRQQQNGLSSQAFEDRKARLIAKAQVEQGEYQPPRLQQMHGFSLQSWRQLASNGFLGSEYDW